jgi:hypothetical protein
MSSFIADGGSEINAFANILLTDAFRKLPTNTHTFIGLSMVILHYDISVRSELGCFVGELPGGQGGDR